MLEHQSREVYNPDTKVADFRRLRVSDMQDNPRVGLPRPRPPAEERTLAGKDHMREQAYTEFMEEHCNEKGFQKCSNLTKQQIRGKIKLQSRTKAGEIIINETDKSGNMTVSSRENYKAQGDAHTQNDEVVDWKTIEVAKKEIKNHLTAICNMFQMGRDWGETMETRVRRAMVELSTVIPQMSCSPKDHKPLPESGVPKTRPLMNASSSMNQRVSDVVSDLMTYLFLTEQKTAEVVSTEDFLSKIEAFNKLVREEKIQAEEIMVSSLDA